MTSSPTTPSEPLEVAPSSSNKDHEDPYLWLEEVESPESLSFAKQANDECLSQLGDPKTSPSNTYQKVLSVLESNDRIAYVTKYGTSPNGDVMMYNLWKDSNNPKGLWRKTISGIQHTDGNAQPNSKSTKMKFRTLPRTQPEHFSAAAIRINASGYGNAIRS